MPFLIDVLEKEDYEYLGRRMFYIDNTYEYINNQTRIEQFTDVDMTEIFIRSGSLISMHLIPVLNVFQGYKNIKMNKKEKINFILSSDDDNNIYKKNNITEEECVICYDTKQKCEFVKMNCNHEFCGTCIKNVLKKETFKEESNCALCREKITTITCRSKMCLDELFQI